jgi:Ca2+-binding EF-hand superfamily protein
MNKQKELIKLKNKYPTFNIKPYLKSGLTKEEIYKLKEAFDLFDIEFNGFLTPEELKQSLNDLGIFSKNNIINKLIEDKIEKIDFNKFIEIMGAKSNCKNVEDVKKLYFVFLGNSNIEEKLSIDNFKKVAEELELELAPNEIEEMINSINPEEPGFISFNEFYNVMMKI